MRKLLSFQRVADRILTFCQMTSTSVGFRPRCRTVAVEGNIASGKSSFLEYFRKFETVKVFPEPVDKWRNLNDHNMLDLLYRNASRWTFAFQMYADLTRFCLHQSTENIKANDVKLMERSLYSGRYCFAENSFRSGDLSQVEYSVLNEYFDWMVTTQQELLHVDLIVYLRTTPENCQQRLLKRCRQEEAGIPLEYLENLHRLYEEWLIEKRYPAPAEVVVVDANDELPSMFAKYDDLAGKIVGTSAVHRNCVSQ